MYTQPENLPPYSRVWIYQSDRKFTAGEEEKIFSLGKQFVDTWTAHNKDLLATFEIRHHAFIIIMIDQEHESASGCSIDKSLHFIQGLEKQFGLSLLDRMIFTYKEGNEIRFVKSSEFDHLLRTGQIGDHTIVFNNLVGTKAALETEWEIPLSQSWHKARV
jgi:hypothetical protein